MSLHYIPPPPAVESSQYIQQRQPLARAGAYLPYEDGLYFGDTLNTVNGKCGAVAYCDTLHIIHSRH